MSDPAAGPCAAPRPGRGLTGLAAAVTAAAVLAGGCATLPTSGTPQSAPARPAFGGGNDGCCGLIVRGPQAGWGPEQVVSGFLLASAQPAHDFALAREYLVPGKPRNSWQPGSAVTIFTQAPKVSPQSGRLSQTVVVTGQEMATLTGDQYNPAASGDQSAQSQDFTMKSVNGRTLIDLLPSSGLLLDDSLFHLVYTARNLYYYGLRNSELVPSPVFLRAGSNLANTLVNDLLHNPPGAQRNVLNTGFPPGARIESVQAVPGKTVIVSIHLPKGTAPATYSAVARQLVATLTSPDYGPRLFSAIKLKVNGVVWSPSKGGPVLTLATPGLGLPHQGGSRPVYYVTPEGGARMLSSRAARGVALPGQAGSGHPALHDVSVSLDGRYLAAIDNAADTVYTSDLGPAPQPGAHPPDRQLHRRLVGAGFSSLSWDNSDDLWVAGRFHHSAGVWVLPPGRSGPIRVYLPTSLRPVTSLRVAPDGIRIAMVVGRKANAHLELADITGNGGSFSLTHVVPLGPSLSAVSAMTWFDGDQLVAAARQISPGPQSATFASQPTSSALGLWEVPVDGDSAASLHWQQPGITSITADGPQNPLYLSIAGGRLEKSVGLGVPWTYVTAGQAADYPG